MDSDTPLGCLPQSPDDPNLNSVKCTRLDYGYKIILLSTKIFSQPVPLRGGLRQGVTFLCVGVCVGVSVRCYLLILLQSFQCRGGIISDLCSLCRSQSLGTSHWYYHLLQLHSADSSLRLRTELSSDDAPLNNAEQRTRIMTEWYFHCRGAPWQHTVCVLGYLPNWVNQSKTRSDWSSFITMHKYI